MTAKSDSPFEAITCPYCHAAVVARVPPARGWPRTAFTRCDTCSKIIVIERLESARYRVRRHRGLLEGFLRL